MKNLILGVLLVFLSTLAYSQGLEDIIVEEIPVTAAATSDDPNLKAGAVAYRVFADLAPNYEIQAVFSLDNHEMIFNTTTSFYNNSTFGTSNGKDILNALLSIYPSLAYDSYITLNAASNTRLGILRSEDITDGIVDGLVAGTALPLQTVGEDFGVPFGTTVFAGKFSTFMGIYNVVGGEQGPTAANRVLLGQFTTDGDFNFELNIQIRPVGSVKYEQYVARNPVGNEILFPKLIYPSAPSVVPPVISLTSPLNGASFNSGESLPITANASDEDGTISLVEFYINGSKVGEDASAPYLYNWTTVEGAAQITARATDNQSNQTTSSPVSITVSGPPVPPTVSITSPANGTSFGAGDAVSIVANASDADGTITRVEFFVNGTKAGEDIITPYEYTWTAVSGSAQLTAVATDNSNSQTTSGAVSITVTDQPGGLPAINITSPANGASVAVGVISITANASDPGGSITLVEFYVNEEKVGEDATAPYQFSWTAANGSMSLTARATDNDGNKTLSSAVNITVGINAAPTVIITSPVSNSTFPAGTQVNIEANATDSDGSISLVEFFRNGVKIGEDATSPYQFTWNSVDGISVLTANATDNNGLFNSSPQVLITISGPGGTPPVVSMITPEDGAVFDEGSLVNISAEATDADGSIDLVEFFRNGIKIGEDNTAPYQFSWLGISGTANLAAQATDNSGLKTTSAIVTITVNGSAVKKDTVIFDFSKAIISNNHYQLPVSINSNRDVTSFGFSTVINTAKITFHEIVNHTAYLTSTNAFDQTTKKLTVSSTSTQAVEKNKKLISVSFTLTTGAITAGDLQQFLSIINGEACESKIIFPTSTPVPPVVAISSPAGGASFTSGTSVPITATATDADGTVSKVEFFVNGTLIGEDASSPYQVNWTAVAGSASLTATASDNLGNQTTSSPVNVTVTSGGNIPPIVSITSPVTGAEFSVGNIITIAASASDPDGTIASVEFYVNDTKVGKDALTPYQFNWIAVAGNSSITAIATDNKGAKTTSAIVTISVNAQPSIAVSSPAEGAEFIAGEIVTIIANAQDGDGNITVVEFFVNNFKVGQDETTPYEYKWTSIAGTAKISALVTDAKGAKTTSNVVNINVNAPPVIEITAPVNGAEGLTGDQVNINVIATDADGSVAKVECYVNNIKIGEDLTAPFEFSWISAAGEAIITAIATDNKGAKATSDPVSISIVNPYEIGTMEAPCNQDKVCIPLNVTKTLADAIGFDMVMKFDPSKVNPTGIITIADDLINPDLADYGSSINQSAGTIAISVFLKSSAPEGTNFRGMGKLICIEFSKAETFELSDTASFTMVSFSESYFTGVISRAVLPGKLTVFKNYSFIGTLKYWSDNSPIAYNIENSAQYLITNIMGSDPLNCSVLSATSVQPDLTGKFDFDIRNGRSIIIDRDILPDSEVQLAVNGMDAQLALKVSLGDPSFIPSVYQLIAIDANMDGMVSSGDISQINQRSILMINEFKQAWNYNNQGVKIVDEPSKDWLFVNEKTISSDPEFKISSTYPEPDGSGYHKLAVPELPLCQPLTISDMENCPDIEPESYLGIMIGDVNGNYGGLPAEGNLKKSTSTEPLIVFDLSHSSLRANKLEFPVNFTADFAVTSLDFQLKFDLKKLVFDTIVMHAENIQPTFFYRESDSTLRFTSYSLATYKANENLLTIRFDVLDESLSKDDFYVPIVESKRLAMLNGNVVPYTFTEYIPTGIEDPLNYNPEISVYPNPAGNLVFVDISEKATVEILDLNGRVLSNKTQLWANQQQEINLQHLTNGMYLLRFQSGNLSTMRKLIVNR